MNIFESIATFAKKEFTNFSMSNNWLGSVNGFGELTCIYQDICVAADTWKMSHNVMVKLPPLIAPAFTRIKAVINSFYVSYASVWKHWNSFISDKPDDVFLNRSLLKGYKGKFVEPYCPTYLIAYICKIAKGNFLGSFDIGDSEYSTVTIDDVEYIQFKPIFNCNKGNLNIGYSDSYYSITWTIENGRRKAILTPRHSDAVVETWSLDHLTPSDSADYFVGVNPLAVDVQKVFRYYSSRPADWLSLGFADERSLLIYLCQSCVRNLESMGVPCDLMAATDLLFYSGTEDFDKFNLLPDICKSSIWQNFFRDEQNQSPEFDYSEVNGCLFNYGAIKESGWQIRLNGLPLNTNSTIPLWFRISSIESAFSLLTGFRLRFIVSNQLDYIQSDNISILPSHYNGLLLTKYRNFEKDYFTSACVDPMMGAVSVSTPSTIEAFRTASKLEEFLERSASARDFYNFMKYNFGTNPESTRYKKPLLLGTKVIPIQISEQLQTSETANTPLGERAGVADGYGNGGTCDHYFNEHGHVFSFLSFVLDSQYMQGMPHQFSHHLQLDYPFPDFANLGAESIPTSEIYYSNYDRLNYNPYTPESRVTERVIDGTSGVQTDISQHPEQFDSVHAPESLSDSTDNGLGVSFGERSVVDNVGDNNLSVISDGDLVFKENRDEPGGAICLGYDGNSGTLRSDPLRYFVTTKTVRYDKGLKIAGASGDSSDLGYGAAVKSDIPADFVQGQSKVFGYVPRYSRWKWHNDVVCGQMRSDLEFWHTFRQFSQVPYIGHSFVSYEDAGFVSDLNRIFAVENDNADKFYLDIFNNCSVRRCLPLVANPHID